MSQGVLPLIGYNHASGDRRRMKQVVCISGGFSLFVSLFCVAFVFLFGDPIVDLFLTGGTESFAYGTKFLKILCVGAPFSAFAYTVISFFQATGHGRRSLVLALLRKGVLDIPLMFLLMRALPVYGIVFATPIADFVCFFVALVLFSVYIGKQKNRIDKTPALCYDD